MKNIRTVSGDADFIECLKSDRIKFFLTSSYTRTAEIEGISVAGAPGLLHLTPTADMEALYYGRAKCLPAVPENPSGPPSPVLIGMSVKEMTGLPLQSINLGLRVSPKSPAITFDVEECGSILEEKGADVQLEKIIDEAERFFEIIKDDADVFIISECVPAGTTTAYAVCKALGKDCDKFTVSSSHRPSCNNLKRDVVEKALKLHGDRLNANDTIRFFGDNMMVFNAVLAGKLSMDKKVVLAGGTQMLAVYAVMQELDIEAEFSNIGIVTTRWVVDDSQSDFEAFAKLINPEINAYCPEFFMASDIENLALYEKGYVKEGVGAGAMIALAYAKGFSQKDILEKIEKSYIQLYNYKK
jgi:uncharacterized protein (TIGR00303 family)